MYVTFLVNTDNCTAWRQTGNCNPDNSREPLNDRDCLSAIQDGWSGYCECRDGSRQMTKGCEAGGFDTCYEACDYCKFEMVFHIWGLIDYSHLILLNN